MATPRSSIKRKDVDYYDIMIIGRTGIGKSTTADKLVIANLKNYCGEETVREAPGRMVMGDLSIWLISDAEGEIERATQRLKYLILLRSLENPHTYMNQSKQTAMKSQLISNEATMVRILDVPRFFGRNHSDLPSVPSDGLTTRVLAIMREVLHIQAAMRMNFKRILYFIPQRGPLERINAILQMELEQMVHYFGRSIFDCMVLCTTMSPDVYEFLLPGVIPFSSDSEMRTHKLFQMALNFMLPTGEQLPDLKPPIVFISMNDTCEDIYAKIQSAPVICDGIRLAFTHQTCARCGIKVKFLGMGEKIACYIKEDPSQSIPYEESLCHPLIISKYWKITKVLGGITHVITAKKYLGKWLNFRIPDDEICVNCGATPGSQGCLRVNTYYKLNDGQLKVDHRFNLDEPVVENDEQVSLQYGKSLLLLKHSLPYGTHMHV